MQGYLRSDGRKGIRNVLVIVYLVECAHHVAREISLSYRQQDVHLIGFCGCFPNHHADKILKRLCTHPNVGGVLLISLGCEGFDRHGLAQSIEQSNRPVQTLVIQDHGGTTRSITDGKIMASSLLQKIHCDRSVPIRVDELVVGALCGGSDATSGLTANPVIGLVFDQLIDQGAAVMFYETAELIGCEQNIADRAVTPSLGQACRDSIIKAARYYQALGHGSFSPGNADGGLTTMEEKSLGAYAKSGSRPVVGLLKPGDLPSIGGLYLLDIVPDGEVQFGFPSQSDVSGVIEMIASGCHLNLFSTGRGSVTGSAISPVIKICANPITYNQMAENMDVNAGEILEGKSGISSVGQKVYQRILDVAGGERTASEHLNHHEFVLIYK